MFSPIIWDGNTVWYLVQHTKTNLNAAHKLILFFYVISPFLSQNARSCKGCQGQAIGQWCKIKGNISREAYLHFANQSLEIEARSSCEKKESWSIMVDLSKQSVFRFFSYVLYSTLLHLPPLRFHCVGGCWDRNQDCCDFGTGSQTL